MALDLSMKKLAEVPPVKALGPAVHSKLCVAVGVPGVVSPHRDSLRGRPLNNKAYGLVWDLGSGCVFGGVVKFMSSPGY